MFEWLAQTETNELAVYGTGIATILASATVAWRGILKGKPTSEAAIKAIAGATCSAPALSMDVSTLKRGQADIYRELSSLHRKLDKLDDIAVRLEDRSRR